MKKIVLSAILLIITITLSLAQIPQAFKYQAIARDNQGSIIANRNVSLRISILSENANGASVYSETHTALTNNFGLINLDIGYGQDPSGQVSDIDWGKGNYYLRIEMDENGGNAFKKMGVSQLLSVPFALYAGSSGGLTNAGKDAGIPANVWSLFGNSSTNSLLDKLGTTDAADLVLVTNNIERMRIQSNGDIGITNNLNIGKDLTVEKNVFLNTVSGSTTNNGAFTVANFSPTLLSGTLTVDQAADFNSSLNVDGVTDLNSAFHVNNTSPSLMTGTLLLNGDGTFNQHLYLDNASYDAISPSIAALVVSGGAGIGKSLHVGDSLIIYKDLRVNGSSKFGGPVTINGPLKLGDLTPSTSPTTGALIVSGGVGIAKQLNVGGTTTLTELLTANNGVSISKSSGGGSETTFNDYPLRVQGGNQGVAIKVNGSRSGSNNFVSFWDQSDGGKMWGRIEGQTNGELLGDPEYIYDNVIFGMEFLISLSNTVMAGIDIAGAASSTTVCAGLGVCVTAPVPSLIIAAVAKGIIQVADLAITVAEPIAYNTFKHTQIGVTYSSGSGDYAEWLRKANPLESFYPGAIVGVRAGQISMNTEGAEKVMVISTKPIVLGNMPEAGNENLYEKVAFMGQVPVKVLGKVNAGDCILPSGYANGIGIAVSPDKLKADDYSRIVGMAWSDAAGDQLNVINVAVGLNNNDAARLVGKQENKIAELETQIQGLQSQINTTNQMLAKLVPGFDLGGGQTNNTPVQMKKQPAAQSGDYSVGDPQERTIVYFKVTKEQIQEGYTLAESMMKEKGIDLDTHPFFKKVRSEPGFKTSFIDEMQESVNKAIDNRSKLDARSGSSVKVY